MPCSVSSLYHSIRCILIGNEPNFLFLSFILNRDNRVETFNVTIRKVASIPLYAAVSAYLKKENKEVPHVALQALDICMRHHLSTMYDFYLILYAIRDNYHLHVLFFIENKNCA